MECTRQRAEYKRKIFILNKRCTRRACGSKTLIQEGHTIYCPKCFWHYSKQGPKKNKK